MNAPDRSRVLADASCPSAAARREEILALLIAAQATRLRRRRRTRAVATAVAMIAVTLAAAVMIRRTVAPGAAQGDAPPAGPTVARATAAPTEVTAPPTSEPAPPSGAPGAPRRQAVPTLRIADDPTIVARLRVDPPGKVIRFGDDDLLRTLRDLGRPTGLVRSQGRVALTDDVTDPPAPPAEGAPRGLAGPPGAAGA